MSLVVGSFYFFGDDFDTGGDGLCVLGIIHADAFVLMMPRLFQAGEEIIAGDD